MNQSSLPPPELIEDEVLMKIVQVLADDYPSEAKALAIELSSSDEPVLALVYTINHPDTKGLLPSRIWYTEDDDIVMMFYVNSTLPKEARPLGEQAFCVFDIRVPLGATLRYDLYTQVFIDQVRTVSGEMRYVFVCAEKELKKLLVARKED